MKLYRTGGYKELIEVIEATRVSEKCYWTNRRNFNGKVVEQRHIKKGSYDQVWETLEEAKEYLIDKTNREITQTKAKLIKLNTKLNELNEYSC